MVQQLTLPRGPTSLRSTETVSPAKESNQELTITDDSTERLSQIVAQERAEDELWVSIYQNAWEDSQDAQIVFDKAGRIFRANRKARLILRCSQKQLRSKSVEELIPERYRTAHRHHTERYLRDPSPQFMGERLSLWLLTADGDELPVEISLSPLDTEHGLFINAVVRCKRGT